MEGRNVVIVTGAANGIGRAFVEHYSRTGDRVVAVDIDESSLSALHTTHGCVVHNVDVSNEAAIRSLVAETIAAYGCIDVFVSNAGILRGVGMAPLEEGPFTSDADWQQSWDVHVMAHVWAARHALPHMLKQAGGGTFINIASAAGLLTEMSSQVYSTTKHAAVGFSEWLALHYADQGIQVHCVCPQGVRTPMVLQATKHHEHLSAGLIEPMDVVHATMDAIEEKSFLVLPHPEVKRYFQNKARDYDWWLGGMRKLKKRLWG